MANYALKAHNLRILLPSHCCTIIFPQLVTLKANYALIQSITATNQGLHGQLYIESTQSKDFTILTLLHRKFPSPECWWCSAVGVE